MQKQLSLFITRHCTFGVSKYSRSSGQFHSFARSFQTVLAASLSWNVLHSELIGKCKSFPEKLASIYEELRDVDLNDEKDIVLAHRLLNHDFMIQFLSTTAKFTVKNMENMVQEILRERQDT